LGSANIVLNGLSAKLSPDSSHIKINTNENSVHNSVDKGGLASAHLASMSDPSENLKT